MLQYVIDNGDVSGEEASEWKLRLCNSELQVAGA